MPRGTGSRTWCAMGRIPPRCEVILASAQAFTSPKIGNIVLMTPDYVRSLIKSFTRKESTDPGV